MLIARAPFRISLAGGGTDLPAYYERHGGQVISTTIDKYVYVHVSPLASDRGVQVTSADFRTFYHHHSSEPMTWDGNLALPRAVLGEFGVRGGLSIFVASEVPPGTGLGSSSAVAVSLVAGVAVQLGQSLGREEIAQLACQVEIDRLGAPIGKQDQYAAAFGGLNAITFRADQVQVERVPVSESAVQQLEQRLMLFFTGTTRSSASILREQRTASEQQSAGTINGLHRIREAAEACRRCLEIGDIDGVGRLLDEGWQQKRRLAPGITNAQIDEIYDLARAHGAIGGKIAGAGGGGFLLLYCHEGQQAEVTRALGERGLRRMDFRFDWSGVDVTAIGWKSALPDLSLT